jgi:hypothetical protein
MILNFGQASNPVVLALPSKNGANPKIPSLHHVLVVATYPKKANVVLSLPSTKGFCEIKARHVIWWNCLRYYLN